MEVIRNISVETAMDSIRQFGACDGGCFEERCLCLVADG